MNSGLSSPRLRSHDPKIFGKPTLSARLLSQLQALLYDFQAVGRLDEARPLIVWLIKIVEEIEARTGESTKTIEFEK